MEEHIPYSIVKMGLLDVSTHVHLGLDIDEIEDKLMELFDGKKGFFWSPVNTLLSYRITTPYKEDAEIRKFMDKVVEELDLLLAQKLTDGKENNLN